MINAQHMLEVNDKGMDMQPYLTIFWDVITYTSALTHRGQDKMATIFQMTFLNAFSWWKGKNFD